MADSRHRFTRNLYLAGLAGAALLVILHVVATIAVLRAVGANPSLRLLAPGIFLVSAGGIVATWFLVKRFIRNVLKPAGRAAAIAQRVAQGDLRSITDQEARQAGE